MSSNPSPLGPQDVIDVRAVFPKVNARLLELLEGLAPGDWLRPTVHPTREVKDLVAHLLHGDVRRLSIHRDGFALPTPPIRGVADLTEFIQSDNREWMAGMRRVSPRILTELVRQFDGECLAFLEGLDPMGEAMFAVAWAGEERSRNWFDVAREYTEKWHHQQQLREATGRPSLYEQELFAPVLETFARGLPFAYREVTCAPGTKVSIVVTGAVDLSWTLRREVEGWSLWPSTDAGAAAVASIDADKVWRIWTKGMTPLEADQCLSVVGERALAEPALKFVAIMA
ncbi:maleylpyruvate isomerase N-terminal domain-containing protein [Chondromyces apiculatus]|nr:maleylpyruvate isomerase N-terminal domain-containing protein [Chondromyces apiculatus]